MRYAITILALALLSGCTSFTETAKRHPYVTGFVVTSLVLCGTKALHDNHGDGAASRETDVTVPRVDCAKASCQ